ncbi:MAG: WD40 repeat domain-containing protein [Microscillaceae bacterium]|jgi:WD40 repeat protein|nr:WD40 repeat domain-containing protein [Microscillaceae bacterium]
MKIQVEKINTLAGHRDCIYTLAANPTDTHFFSAGGDGMVARWDLHQPEIGELIAKIPNSVYALATIPTQNHLLIGQNYEGLHWIDLASKQEIASLKITNAAIFDIQIIDNQAFVACGDGVVIVVDMPTMNVRKHLKASDKSARCLAINPLTREFAVGYSDNFIRVFDLNTLDLKYAWQAHKNSIFTLQYSPDFAYLLSGSRDAHLKIWQVAPRYPVVQSIVAHLYALNHLVFSPDGQYFATCSMDKSIKVWSAHTWQLLKVIDKARHAGHATSVNKLWWSDYQNLLISASDDRMISIWKLDFLES